MNLLEILKDIVQNDDEPTLVSNGQEEKASELLETLHPVKLKRQAHFQKGLYIAEINEDGYLGQVMYKVKQN